MDKKLIALVVLSIAASICALADPLPSCRAGTVDTVLGTTCTIGDENFQFSQDVLFGVFSFTPGMPTVSIAALPTDDLIFTPDASHPDSPGFTITPAPGFSFSETSSSPGLLMSFGWFGIGTNITDPSSGA